MASSSALGRSGPGRGGEGKRLSAANARFGRGLVTPAALILMLLLLIPSVLTLLYSFYKVPPSGDGLGTFAGFDNYRDVFGSPVFWRSLQVTAVFSFGFVILSTVMGLAFAILLNEKFRGQGLARALLVLPWATPWLVIGIVWKWYADGSVGGLNGMLLSLHLIDDYVDFLSDPNTAMPIAILAGAWRQSCFSAILCLAGLQTLPRELYEAAAMDGASAWKRFVYVVLPWLRPVLGTVTVLNVIYAFLQFDVIYALTQGGPGDATQVLSILIYRQLFVVTDIGTGSALAVVLGAIALVGGLATVRLIYGKRED